MKAKEFVKSKLPTARAESHRTTGGEKYWLIREQGKFMYFCEGKTEGKAWTNAKKKLLQQQTSE